MRKEKDSLGELNVPDDALDKKCVRGIIAYEAVCRS
jgi:fumarate hydratase class II